MKNGVRKKTNNTSTSQESADLNAEIARRAYEIWLNEGGPHGCDQDHWFRAERELAERKAPVQTVQPAVLNPKNAVQPRMHTA